MSAGRRQWRNALLALALAALPPGPVQALGESCTVNSPSLGFGGYDPTSASATTANATITVTCTALLALSIPFTAKLSGGGSGNPANRRMSGGASNLPYNLYTSSGYTTVWDNTTGVSGSVAVVGVLGLFSGSTDLTAFGRILANQIVPAGAYGDSVTITVSY